MPAMITDPFQRLGLDREVLSVSQLNNRARLLLEDVFGGIWVEGEISNLARPASGHIYFTLKDSQAQVRCALFRQNAARVRQALRDGLAVRGRGKVSLFTPELDAFLQAVVERCAVLVHVVDMATMEPGRDPESDIEALEHTGPVDDPQSQVIAEVLLSVVPPAFYLDIIYFSLAILRLVEISLVRGETSHSVVGYAYFALLLVTVLGEHELAGRIGRMTLRRTAHVSDVAVRTKVHTLWGWFAGPWHEPLPEILGHLRIGQQTGVEAGDLSAYGAFALLGQDTLLLCRGDNIADVEAQFIKHRATYVQLQHELAAATVDVVTAQLPRLRATASTLAPEAAPGPELAGSALGTHHFLRMQRFYMQVSNFLADIISRYPALKKFGSIRQSGKGKLY